MVLDYSIADAEAESGAFSDFLGSKKGIEYPAEVLLRYPGAVVANYKVDHIADLMCLHCELATTLSLEHGVFRIGYEIEHYLLYLVTVSHGPGTFGLQLDIYLAVIDG